MDAVKALTPALSRRQTVSPDLVIMPGVALTPNPSPNGRGGQQAASTQEQEVAFLRAYIAVIKQELFAAGGDGRKLLVRTLLLCLAESELWKLTGAWE